jgi:hypothetical protein
VPAPPANDLPQLHAIVENPVPHPTVDPNGTVNALTQLCTLPAFLEFKAFLKGFGRAGHERYEASHEENTALRIVVRVRRQLIRSRSDNRDGHI